LLVRHTTAVADFILIGEECLLLAVLVLLGFRKKLERV
jgi:hypothetical protein